MSMTQTVFKSWKQSNSSCASVTPSHHSATQPPFMGAAASWHHWRMLFLLESSLYTVEFHPIVSLKIWSFLTDLQFPVGITLFVLDVLGDFSCTDFSLADLNLHSLGNSTPGWGDSSVSKALCMQVWGKEFKSQKYQLNSHAKNPC